MEDCEQNHEQEQEAERAVLDRQRQAREEEVGRESEQN